MNKRARAYFEEAGFTVTNVSGLNIDVVGSGRDVTSHGSVHPTAPYRQVVELDDSTVDGIVISCTNYRAMDAINTLETDLGKPIITSNQAMLWDALRTVGVRYADIDLGQLFDQ